MHLVSFLHPPFLPRYGLVWPTKHAAIWRVLSFSICWYSWLEWTNQPQVFVCTLCASVPFQTLTVVERNPVVPRPVYTPKNEPREVCHVAEISWCNHRTNALHRYQAQTSRTEGTNDNLDTMEEAIEM